jgi:hypothetical protein
MSEERAVAKKTFTYAEAEALLPEVQRLTEEAFRAVERASAALTTAGTDAESVRARVERLVADWANALVAMGLEVKGLWLVDFDNGSGYYCWRHPEPQLQYFHSYEEGFRGRMRIQ